MRRDTPFVLVVDSDADAAESTRDVLALCGFAAKSVTSCAEALAAAHPAPPWAVITDVRLADGDGRGLADRMRAMSHPALAVIAVSEFPPPLVTTFDHYFIKPADPRELVSLLRRYLPAAPIAV